ncbi:MAG TPA: TonB-dependent receptor [Bacteroidales bacterium]
MRLSIFTRFMLLIALFSFGGQAFAKDSSGKTYAISGYIKDGSNGEALTGATVYIRSLKSGVTTNLYGFYSISLPEGSYLLEFSFLGYATKQQQADLRENVTLNIDLMLRHEELTEVEIVGQRKDDNIKKPEMSVVRMDVKAINRIPALFGEVDLIKAIQLLPGVQATSEGSTGFSVRGGNPDQNLILLDEAVVYNASHLLGFFSVFNNDAIKDVTLYKGDIPASSGGRLSSLLDVRMKDGNSRKFAATGGLGLISSRLTLESPVFNDNTSFIVSGRRTYADLFLPLANNKDIRDNKLYFYDLNAKATHRFDDNNRIFLSGYFGRDIFSNQFALMSLGNQTATLRWNHLFSKSLFSNFSIIYSKYDYSLGTPEGEASAFKWTSNLRDYSAKADFSWFLSPLSTIKFGASTTYHEFSPGDARGVGDSTLISEYILPGSYALEHGIYISNEQKISGLLTLKYGLRLSVFQNVGAATLYHYNAGFEAIDSTIFGKGKFFNNYAALEPRIGLNYAINELSSVKASYSRTAQYVHLAQNSTAGTPLDIWFPSSPNIKPSIADQVALGYFRNIRHNTVETSVEVYYKKMGNVIDFRDHAQLLLNRKLDGELRFGNAWAYGLEMMVKIPEGRLNGWVSYTLSASKRKIAEINSGNIYSAPYDKPHNISVVFNYELSKRVLISANWVYATGIPVTYPTGRAVIGNKIVPIYSDRNAYRLPDYHRLDIAVTLKGKSKEGRRWHGEWNFSVYNAYGRRNAWTINFVQDDKNPNITYAEKTYLFSVIPSVTYNFTF